MLSACFNLGWGTGLETPFSRKSAPPTHLCILGTSTCAHWCGNTVAVPSSSWETGPRRGLSTTDRPGLPWDHTEYRRFRLVCVVERRPHLGVAGDPSRALTRNTEYDRPVCVVGRRPPSGLSATRPGLPWEYTIHGTPKMSICSVFLSMVYLLLLLRECRPFPHSPLPCSFSKPVRLGGSRRLRRRWAEGEQQQRAAATVAVAAAAAEQTMAVLVPRPASGRRKSTRRAGGRRRNGGR